MANGREYIQAQHMATAVGIDPIFYRHKLREAYPERLHYGRWVTVRGSDEYLAWLAILTRLVYERHARAMERARRLA